MRVDKPGYYYATCDHCKWIIHFIEFNSSSHHKSNIICIHNNTFLLNKTGTSLGYEREATKEEIEWMEACKKAGGYVPNPLLKPNYDDYILTF